MVEETVKQTRCTTCDAEHPYKGGQAPRRRKKDGPSSLYKEVLAGKPDNDLPPMDDAPEVFAAADAADDGDSADGDVNGNVMTRRPWATGARDGEPAGALRFVVSFRPKPRRRFSTTPRQRVRDPEDGPVHRQLIRATLPRIEGHKEERKPTDFTIRQAGGRGNNPGNHFRGGGGRERSVAPGRSRRAWRQPRQRWRQSRSPWQRPPAPGRSTRSPARARARARAKARGRAGGGPGGGFRSAQQPRHGGGGRKRSR